MTVTDVFKIANFTVPDFGEFDAPPVTSAGVDVVQSSTAKHADAVLGEGMLVTMNSGEIGSGYIEYNYGSELASIAVGVAIDIQDNVTGSFTAMQGRDGANAQAWSVVINTATNSILFSIDGQSQYHFYNNLQRWLHIEVVITPTAASMWVNGVIVDTETISDVNTQRVRVGAISTGTIASGDLYYDHLVIASAQIGPYAKTPALPLLSDPARWLVIYNLDDDDSIDWAYWYANHRRVPICNLLGLSLPTTETLTTAERDALETAINTYLTTHNMTHVCGLILGYKVPAVLSDGLECSLQTSLMDLVSVTPNGPTPWYAHNNRSILIDYLGINNNSFIVMDIAGSTLAAAKALSTNADALTSLDGVGRGFSTLSSTDLIGTADTFAAFGEGLNAQLLRLNVDADFDGSEHGNAVDVSDDQGGAFTIAGQSKVMFITGGANTALNVK